MKQKVRPSERLDKEIQEKMQQGLAAAVATAQADGEGLLSDLMCLTVRRLLQREFCTIREGEVSLTDLWFLSHEKEAEQRRGRPLTNEERQEVRRQFPPPREIDFRMR